MLHGNAAQERGEQHNVSVCEWARAASSNAGPELGFRRLI